MASQATASDADLRSASGDAALQHNLWRSFRGLSSILSGLENFLARSGHDRAPWLAVAFAAGIMAWFALDNRWQWLGLLALCGATAAGVAALLRRGGTSPFVRQTFLALTLALAAGTGTVWLKSAMVGVRPIARPVIAQIDGTVLDHDERPSEQRVRLLLAIREPGSGRAIRVRVNLRAEHNMPGLGRGAVIRLKARLLPPSPPLLPGGYDFARTAWFQGIAATGSALGPVRLITAPVQTGGFAQMRASLSRHVRSQLDGRTGTIAAALASGDRGAIATEDDQAMRDSGLAHLLSISGLHVSAVVAAAYAVALRLLALWPWLALRVRLPLLAAAAGAGAGVFYTLLSGAEVPTIRSCIGAVLVLGALALGREPLSMRMLAVAALFVMLFWPEAVMGPSFQMSFAAAIAIVALHGAGPVQAFLKPREEGWLAWAGRRIAMLLMAGVVIELALMPIGLFHFHRAGIYGALANVIAIPLTTLLTMPLIALALALDLAGAGAPAWWLVGKSLELLLWLAHWVAKRPGAVTMLPAMGAGPILTIVAGGLWLALWRGRVRLLGFAPTMTGVLALSGLGPPDMLISGDGRHVGLIGQDGTLFVLRDGRGGFGGDSLIEAAGMNGTVRLIADWPGAQCSREFCAIRIRSAGRDLRLLIGRGKEQVPERALAAACDRADIVVAERWLPRSCRPALLKADRALMARTGGLALDLARRRVRTVAEDQGAHGWWQAVSASGLARPQRNTVPAPAGQSGSSGTSSLSPSGTAPTAPARNQ